MQTVHHFGLPQPPPPQTKLRAGRLSLVYEGGDLRYVRLGQKEIIRRVYAAVRDANWGTVATRLTDELIHQGPDSFQIQYTATHLQGEIDFVWHADIQGHADGTVVFNFSGVARSTFRRNRLGFCVLHPIPEVVGARVRVTHALGARSEGVFPQFIDPSAPFREIHKLAHEVQPGVWVELEFEGDTFEMEDQRNWTDASFKTFCTPLRLPFPVEVRAGTKLTQRVTLRLIQEAGPGAISSATGDLGSSAPVALELPDVPAVPLPHIGLCVASHQQPWSDLEKQRLAALHPAHLRVDLHLTAAAWVTHLHAAAAQARDLGARLEVALHLSQQAEFELRSAGDVVRQHHLPVARWLVFQIHEKSTTAGWLKLARAILPAAAPGAEIVSGSNAYFTELNRGRPATEFLDGLCYSINPQVHAFDNASLVETLQTLPALVESAGQFAHGRKVVVTPVTFKPRFNPDATGSGTALPSDEPPPQVDPRQLSLFGAAWTLGCLKNLIESAVHSITFFETTGPRGLMETSAGSLWPEAFPSKPGMVFPLYHVFADLAALRGAEVVPVRSSNPLAVEALLLRNKTQALLLLANFSAQSQSVRLPAGSSFTLLRWLGPNQYDSATLEPENYRRSQLTAPGSGSLLLPPCSLARLAGAPPARS